MSARHADGGDIELNLTPMIDVVFNMIVFFMIVTDLTQKEIDEVELPSASMAVADSREDDRVIVNVMQGEGEAATVRVRGRDHDGDSLRALLFRAAERKRDVNGFASRVPVLIRADARVPWREVRVVLQACADPGVRIHRISFGTAEDATGE